MRKFNFLVSLIWLAIFFPLAASAQDLKTFFAQYNAASTTSIDHTALTALLSAHVKPDATGLNRLDYKALSTSDNKTKLSAYLKMLEGTDVTKLNRNEQFAFWANLYNAKTIEIVIDHYPVKSIRDIDISGFFSNGPWGKKVTKVNGTDLSLNDIEHVIMRGIWKDPLVHYAVNCASVGCPNLQTEAFTGEKLAQQLEAAARSYVNSSRGAVVKGGRLQVSKIYSWFDEDFGNSQTGVIAHVKKYANEKLAGELGKITRISGYFYDWSLNDIQR